MSIPSLPSDSPDQTFVSVQAIVGGHFFLPYLEVFEDCRGHPANEGCRVPSLAFLITHPSHGRALFDLGLRKHNQGYPPALESALEYFQMECSEDVADVLQNGAVDPATIKRVFYSHLHFDHVGDLDRFPSAEVVLGEDAEGLLADAYPKNPDSDIQGLPLGRPVTYVPFTDNATQGKVLSPLGMFERGVDFYGDGSLYLVDAPGHMPGHLSAFARVAPDGFLLLAGDTCHNRECYCPGERLVSSENHQDTAKARETVKRLVRTNEEVPNVIVVIAHEKEREDEMPLFPDELGPWAMSEIDKRRRDKQI
ncbi:hypothetical protein NM688_g2559 [Phlebia brevispora]|uniref:Uncharacterized protein n=1 Tax=Phlebia brevispora TaxID=194682 RepID=A0ACC1T8G3_9APHY|nr:hypothetical protein NM688_g2559 [Phlebia brevispora]